MAVKDAITAANNWATRSGASQQAFSDGVAQTTKDPTALAAAQAQAMLANVTAAVTSGRWARRLQEVGVAGWKAAVAAKAANYGTGIAAGKTRYQDAYGQMLPTMQALQSQIDSMPSGTLADSLARVNTWITGMHNWKLNR